MKNVVFLLLFIPFISQAQEHIPVFPNLTGDTLIMSIQNSYTPAIVLDYSMARDTLFKNIDSKNDTLFGIYTVHGVYLPPEEDPTEAAFKNGAANGINTEHAWPRSKGASEGNAESDMQHLYPSRTPVNADRANLPYGEVPDQQTQKWYFKDHTLNSIPPNKIDDYSELGNSAFEPREQVKGDIARSMFYFYTIYRAEAEREDPAFFDIQRADLCTWLLADPVDETEWLRTQSIATYQDGIRNPFILDCTLAKRTYCPELQDCHPVNSVEAPSADVALRVYPNPADEQITVFIHANSSNMKGTLRIYDLWGNSIITPIMTRTNHWQINTENLAAGIYILYWKSDSSTAIHKSQKLIVRP